MRFHRIKTGAIRKVIFSLFILVLSKDAFALNNMNKQMYWMIGQTVISKNKLRDGLNEITFLSSGFVYKKGDNVFFITTAHSLKLFSQNYPPTDTLVAYLPNLPSVKGKLYPIKLLFTEEAEDAAVFSIEHLEIQGDYNTPYKPIHELSEGSNLYFGGYHNANLNSPPDIVSIKLLTCAKVINQLYRLGCDDIEPDDIIEFYAKGELSIKGMSGSPVFEEDQGNLTGILIGFGDDKKDKRVSEALGVSSFNIIRPLVKTLSRIQNDN